MNDAFDRPIAFAGVRAFDGRAWHERLTVCVEGGRIVAASADAEPPEAALAMGGDGRTLLPGFIDAHVHIGFFDAREVLRGGITAARDLGWPLAKVASLAEDLTAPSPGGPRLLFAGPVLTAPGGYPSLASWAPGGTAREIADAPEAREAVRELAHRGAAVIKVAQEPRAGPTLPSEVLAAVVEEARALGLGVTSHCGSLAELEAALDAGVGELAHGLWSDERIPDGTVARMVAAGIVVVPTLHIDPTEARIDNVARFVRAGGHVVYGTDMGNRWVPPRIDLEELRLLGRAGMSLDDVLTAATAGAADHLGLGDRGRIAVGATADLLLVDGDPREDLAVIERRIVVMREGMMGR